MLLIALLVSGSQLHAKPIRIKHTTTAVVWESQLDVSELTTRQRLLVVRSIERSRRPSHALPLSHWQKQELAKHKRRHEDMLSDAVNGRLIRVPLGSLDEWARRTKLPGIIIINEEKPE